MEIVRFCENFCSQAADLALANYEEERAFVTVLPAIGDIPWVKKFASNGLGVAAVDSGRLLGFLCCTDPIKNHFGCSTGVFSPIHAHGAVYENRKRIFSKLYEAAAGLWVRHGITSHAIALYAHDRPAVESFFWNGFGLRCTDAIYQVEPEMTGHVTDDIFFELPVGDAGEILKLKNALINHLIISPVFIPLSQVMEEEFADGSKKRGSRFFCAKKGPDIVGYIEISPYGENFVTGERTMANICGAYLKENWRGTGVFTDLLSFVIRTLAGEGFLRLGVDFESFNPTAREFWLKFFTPYTYSMTRRIDERIVDIQVHVPVV